MTKNDVLTDLQLDSIKVRPSAYEGARNACLVVVEGYVDTYNSSDFKDKVMELFRAGFERFILDFQRVKYVSSTGVGCIITVLKELRAVGGDLVLYKAPDEVYQVIQILGFSKIIVNFDSKDEINGYFGEKQAESFSFPAIAACPSCSKKLKVMHAGRFRCTGCSAVFLVQDNGSVNLQVAPSRPAKG